MVGAVHVHFSSAPLGAPWALEGRQQGQHWAAVWAEFDGLAGLFCHTWAQEQWQVQSMCMPQHAHGHGGCHAPVWWLVLSLTVGGPN